MKRITLLILFSVFGIVSFAQKKFTPVHDPAVTICQSEKCAVITHPVNAEANATIIGSVGNFFASLFDTSMWPERWHCGIWTPLHGWTYILSDFFIWLSYFAIPAILGFFVYKKRIEGSIPFKDVLVLFIIFILACGLTHLMDAAIFWWPAYKLSALLRFVTAIVSMFTVFSLIKVIPDVLELKSPAFLEKQVQERTKMLQELNEQLNIEIQARKRITDNLSDSNQELMAFSYSVSHDLRTPLRSIHGFTQALQEDYAPRFDKEGNDYLNRICAASSRMGELIDDMLKLSRISRNEIATENVDLTALVHDVVTGLRHQNAGMDVTFEIADNIHVQADKKLIRIAIENLLDNAIKYSSKNKAPLVEFGKDEEQGALYIKDNGVGFDMKYSDKLFGAFQRLHDSDFEGTGIGLATVKRIILKHSGRIWADAKVNQGAIFYFSL